MRPTLKVLRREKRRDTGGELLERVWGLCTYPGRSVDARLDAYLNHYNNLTLLASTLEAFDDRDHVVELIALVRNQSSETVDIIVDAVKQASSRWRKPAFSDSEALEALQFALKLWLFSNPVLNQSSLTLADLNKSLHTHAVQTTSQTHAKSGGLLSTDFSAKSLTRKGGFYLIWTSDLSEHLTFASKDQLRVFRHAQILLQYQRQQESTLFPDSFLEETYRTIHLLFPFEDFRTSKRVRRIVKKERVDIEAAMTEKAMEELDTYQLSTYQFYGARLAEIQRRYDLARPHRLAQWWYDRRQRPEWAALMVALIVFVLTILFGIAQTVTGVLQVVASWH